MAIIGPSLNVSFEIVNEKTKIEWLYKRRKEVEMSQESHMVVQPKAERLGEKMKKKKKIGEDGE